MPKSTKPVATRWTRSLPLSLVLCIALAAVSLSSTAQTNETDSAQTLVENADRIRFPAEGFQVEVAITSSAPDLAPETRQYKVLSKGNDNTVILTIEPALDRGQILLMKAHDLWLFMPSVSQPVRLSVAQRMTGQVAYGDIARANFSGDYTPKIVRTETIDGETYSVLELTALDRSVTYAKVIYWIKQSNNSPYKAEFYSVSNRLLKSCLYTEFKEMGGRIRPTRLVLEDAVKKGEISIMEYTGMKKRNLPDYVFTKEYLKKLD